MAGFSLHFRKPLDWGASLFLHYWNANPGGGSTAWPGVRMNADGDGWFSLELPDIAAISLVFNDDAGRQTADLYRDREGWFDLDERWSDAAPGGMPGGRPGQRPGPMRQPQPQPLRPPSPMRPSPEPTSARRRSIF